MKLQNPSCKEKSFPKLRYLIQNDTVGGGWGEVGGGEQAVEFTEEPDAWMSFTLIVS